MIIIAPELDKRLDAFWWKLQQLLLEQNPGISQIDLDTKCIESLEFLLLLEKHHQ